MSTVLTPVPVEAPRGARWAADAFVAFIEFAQGVAAAVRARRARSQRLREAAEVRGIAQSYARAGDHRLAADLYAAADRHDFGL